VAYAGSIPLAALTRYCVIDTNIQKQFAGEAYLMPHITSKEYERNSKKWQQFIQWAFGDRPTWPDVFKITYQAKFREQYEQLRDGIEVVNLQPEAVMT